MVHIPRVAGTSIEKWICGQDWWDIEKETKHILASQAKELYKDYWDDYFKFSFVRNPWDRVVSLLKFEMFYGIRCTGLYPFPFIGRYEKAFRTLPFLRRWQFEEYYDLFGDNNDVLIEFDPRFYTREDVVKPQHIADQIYGNIIDEELDFIGTLENLTEDVEKIREILGIETQMNIHTEASKRRTHYSKYYTKAGKDAVARMYKNDIERYGFSY